MKRHIGIITIVLCVSLAAAGAWATDVTNLPVKNAGTITSADRVIGYDPNDPTDHPSGTGYTYPIGTISSKIRTDGVTSAAAAPTANHDSGAGYLVGDWWIDTSTDPDTVYICVDNTNDAAVWMGPTKIATVSDVNAGTSEAASITPVALAGSNFGTRTVVMRVFYRDEEVAEGDGAETFTVTGSLDGWTIVGVGMHVYTPSSSGDPLVTIYNATVGADILTTGVSVQATELDSSAEGTTPPAINATYAVVSEGDELDFNVDAAGTGTEGCDIRMDFRFIPAE